MKNEQELFDTINEIIIEARLGKVSPNAAAVGRELAMTQVEVTVWEQTGGEL